MSPTHNQLRRLVGLVLAPLLFTLIFLGRGVTTQQWSLLGHGNISCCVGSACSPYVNVSQAPVITILSGLRPNAPHISTLAYEHTQRALTPSRDVRLSLVELAGEVGASLEQEGPGLSDSWFVPTGALDVELLWDVRHVNYAQPSAAATAAAGSAANSSAALAVMESAAVPDASKGSVPVWNARVVGAVEYATVPLLRDHTSGNGSSVRHLEAEAAAGEPLPPQLLVPRPGQPGGPPAVPLLLLYRRDWWRALVAAGAGAGGSGDVAEAAEAALPPTWKLLVQLVSEHLNRDLDGDGVQDHVLCVDLMPGCKGWALLSAIFSSLVQTNGTQQGVWFDLADMTPALGGPAMPAALRLYADLAAANAAPFTPGGSNVSRSIVPVSLTELLAGGGTVDPDSGAPQCGAVNPLFAAGRCLFTLDWATAALRLTRDAAPDAAGRVGAALLPGSDMVAVVLPPPATPLTTPPASPSGHPPASAPTPPPPGPDIGHVTMEQCTAMACPYGDLVSAAALAAVLRVKAAGAPAAAAEGGLRVNRAPLLGDASNVWLLGAGQSVDDFIRVDDFLRLVGYQLGLKYLALLRPMLLQQQRMAPPPPPQPLASALEASVFPATSVAMYPAVAMDLEAVDAVAVLQAVNSSVAHPNAAMDILLPQSSVYREVIDRLAADAVLLLLRLGARGAVGTAAVAAAPAQAAEGAAADDGSLSSALEALVAEAAEGLSRATQGFPYPSLTMHLYRHSIGAPPPPDVAPALAAAAGGGSRPLPWQVAVPVTVSAVGFAAAAVMAVCLAAALRRRWRAKRRLPPCRAKPPGAGPATTMALTDVQSSTALWEALSAEMMDACMSLHHGIMRKAIEAHGGYEVFTEGDAFAVVFHGPNDALGFALDVQAAMLAADWPPELLDHPEAAEVWARRNSHLQWTALASANVASAAAAAAAAVAAGGVSVGSPRRITSTGASAPASGGGGGGGGNGGGGVGGGLDGTLLGLARLTKGSKRLRALLRGGGSGSKGSGVPASSIISGESFRAPASAVMLRLLPPSVNAAAAVAAAGGGGFNPQVSPCQSQRPSSGLAHLEGAALSQAHGASPTGAGSAAAAALAAAEVEAVAAISGFSSLGCSPWSAGGPRPLPSMAAFERLRHAQTHGSSGADLWGTFRAWNTSPPAVRMAHILGRKSAENSIPWDQAAPVALTSGPVPPATAAPAAGYLPGGSSVQAGTMAGGAVWTQQSADAVGYGYAHWNRAGGGGGAGQVLPRLPQLGLWQPQVRSQSLNTAEQRQLAAPVLRVSGELLEQSIALSPQQPMAVPTAYLAASRSAGAATCGSSLAARGPIPPPLLPRPPLPQQLLLQTREDTAAAAGAAQAVAAAAAAAAMTVASSPRRRAVPVRSASLGLSPPYTPVGSHAEAASLSGTSPFGGDRPRPVSLRRAGSSSPRPAAGEGVASEPRSGATGGAIVSGAQGGAAEGGGRAAPSMAPVARSALVPSAELVCATPDAATGAPAPRHQQGSPAPSTPPTPPALLHTSPPQMPPPLPLHQLPHPPRSPLSAPGPIGAQPPTDPQPLRWSPHNAGIALPLQPQQPHPHPRRGAVRTASRLSLVSGNNDRDSDAAARGGTGGGGRRNRFLSLFSSGLKSLAAATSSGSNASFSWADGSLQPERSGAAAGPQRLASFTAASLPSRSSAGVMSAAAALAAGRSRSFTARQRPDPDRLWPLTRGSPLQPVLSGSSDSLLEQGGLPPPAQSSPPHSPRHFPNSLHPYQHHQCHIQRQHSADPPHPPQALFQSQAQGRERRELPSRQQQQETEQQQQQQAKQLSTRPQLRPPPQRQPGGTAALGPIACAAALGGSPHDHPPEGPHAASVAPAGPPPHAASEPAVGTAATAISICSAASTSVLLPRRVSFRLAGLTLTAPPTDPDPDPAAAPSPAVERGPQPGTRQVDPMSVPAPEPQQDLPQQDLQQDQQDPDSSPFVPEQIPGRDCSLDPWLDLQVVQDVAELWAPRDPFGGLPRLAEGHEGDEGTTSMTRTFEGASTTSRHSCEGWPWQPPSRPDVVVSTSVPRLSLTPAAPSQRLIAAAAATAARPRPDAPRALTRKGSSTASSRRRSTGCSFGSSGSAGDLWRALHDVASAANTMKRRSVAVMETAAATMAKGTATATPASSVTVLQPTAPSMSLQICRPHEPASGGGGAVAATPLRVQPTPATRRRSAELVDDAVMLEALISSSASLEAATAGQAEGSAEAPRCHRWRGSHGANGDGGDGGDDGNGAFGGKLIAVDVDVDALRETDRVQGCAGSRTTDAVGGGGCAATAVAANGSCSKRAISMPMRSAGARLVPVPGQFAEPATKRKSCELKRDCDGGGGGGRRHRGGGAGGLQAHDPAAALDHFDDAAGGQLMEWRSVVSWEADLEQPSGPLELETMDICPQALATMAAGISQQLPGVSPAGGGGVGGNVVKDADGSQHGGNPRSAFFRTWRNMGGAGAQLGSEVGLGTSPPASQLSRRHVCNGTSAPASGGGGCVNGGGDAGALGAGAGGGTLLLSTPSTSHQADGATDGGSQEDLRRTSTAASGRLLSRLGLAVRKAVLRGALGDRDRGRGEREERDVEKAHGHPHARSEGAAPADLGQLPGQLLAGQRPLGSTAPWLHRPSRLRSATEGGRSGGGGGGGVSSQARSSLSSRGSSGDSGGSGMRSAASVEISGGEDGAEAMSIGTDGGSGGRAGKGGDGTGHGRCGDEEAAGDDAAGGADGGGGERLCTEDEAFAMGETVGLGYEPHVQSGAGWDSAAAAVAAMAATGASLAPPQQGLPYGLHSTALAALANDSDDARSYYLRNPEYMYGNAPAMYFGNIAAAGAAAAASVPMPAVARAAAGEDAGAFDLLWRDLNAAASARPFLQPPPPVAAKRSGPSDGWPQAAVPTVASALRLLYDQLTHAEAVLAYIMEGNSGVHRESSGTTAGGGCGPELVLRGLRIRIGLHSGPREDEVELAVVERALVGRYRGDFLAACKEVSEAAVGGMVVLSGATFRAHQQQLRTRTRPQQDAVMLLHLGDHILRSVASADPDYTRASTALLAIAVEQSTASPPRELYAALSPGLLPRLAVLPAPVRTAREVVPGCLSAPAGLVSPVFCNVVGVEALLAWEKVLQARMARKASTNMGLPGSQAAAPHSGSHVQPHPAVQHQPSSGASLETGGGGGEGVVHTALELLRNAILEVTAMHDGYVVASSADGGHWVLVFGCAEKAVLWGLAMLEAMLRAAWPEGLMEHELTEEVWEGSTLLKRGLRLRIGIDCGRAMVRLVPRTGRLDYVGRPLNRAARIAAKAKAATMLVSDAVWAAARPYLGAVVRPTSLGAVQLKGVKEPLELWALRGRHTTGSGGGSRRALC